MRDTTAETVIDLEARVVALQTLVGYLLKVVHENVPQSMDARLALARRQRDVAMNDPAYDAVGREALHLQVAMLENAARGGRD
ncbi:MAG TPA: hypothetical protein VG939_10830 [Caulobacteraceae bacterium]|nr:hypothetical protein [Caulobacteraceae bacterium]